VNKTSANTLEFKFERTIPAPPTEVYDGWLNPAIPGTPWYESNKLIFDPRVDGLFYWLFKEHPHFGRFLELKRPSRIQHSWMSQSTLGQESTVTVTFEKKGEGTLMTLHHAGLPDEEIAKNHEKGWNYFLDKLVEQFQAVAPAKK
jgi:uncharacterized protein YndB with AHSA1/START domain